MVPEPARPEILVSAVQSRPCPPSSTCLAGLTAEHPPILALLPAIRSGSVGGGKPMLIAVPDLVTNSYFPALAAEELGLFRAQGLEAHVDLLAPALGAMAALRDGQVQAVVTGAHTTLTAFPGWKGAKAVVAVAQGTPWLLVLRADLPATRGDVGAVKGRRIGAAPGPDLALKRLLAESGIDP